MVSQFQDRRHVIEGPTGKGATREQASWDDALRTLWEQDRTGLPRYQRVANALLDAIKQGACRPGDRLPAEEDLAKLTPFSLGTVQRALRSLVEQGLVVRRHGLGSFLVDKPHRIHDPGLAQFLGDDGVSILPIYSEVVARKMVEGEGAWNRFLGTDTSAVMYVDRVVSVNDEFKLFSRFYADRKLLKRLWDVPIKQLHGVNFTRMIAEECRLPISEITHLVRIDRFEPRICDLVQIDHEVPGLFVQAVAKAGRDICVYYQEFFIPPTSRPLQFPELGSHAIEKAPRAR